MTHDLTNRQIGLLRDMANDGAVKALLFSPFASEGPRLRDLGLIGGAGDATGLTNAGAMALTLSDDGE